MDTLIALKRNQNDGGDQALKKMANLGLILGLVSMIVILVLFAVTWFASTNTPPDISTPMPPKTIP